jgi:lysophospholipase L1-like esterase
MLVPTDARGGAMLRAGLVIAFPLLLFLYPTAALVSGTSQSAAILGKYSPAAGTFIIAVLAVYVALVLGILRRNTILLTASLLALVAMTYVLPSSNSVLGQPGVLTIVAASRLAAAVSLAVVATVSGRGLVASNRGRSAALICAAVLFIPALIDFLFLASQAVGVSNGTTSVGVSYRTPYDLSKLSDRDVVLVGDSFVWGQGVEIDQRVGDVLQARLQRLDPGARVYSLGSIGAGLNEYRDALANLPSQVRARRVIVAFYQNDMPARDTIDVRMEQLSLAVGRSSISARLLLDLARLSFAPDVDGYIRVLEANFDERMSDHGLRWSALTAAFGELFELASHRSIEPPVLAIIPVLSGSDGKKWRTIHDRLTAAARAAGFDVVDLYDALKVGTAATLDHRLAPNDLHFNVQGNRVFADQLFQALQNGASRRGGR